MKAIISALSRGSRRIRLLAEIIGGGFQPGLAKLVHRIVVRHLNGNREFRAHR